jgi:hypothetical protein
MVDHSGCRVGRVVSALERSDHHGVPKLWELVDLDHPPSLCANMSGSGIARQAAWGRT